MIPETKKDASLAIVIPTLNEAGNIHTIISQLLNDPRITSIIVVDDHSADRTVDEVKEIQKRSSQVHLIQRTQKRSFAQSYKEGFEYALKIGADLIIQMDADGSHDYQDLLKIYTALHTYDLVIGSRYIDGGTIEGWNFRRKMISRLGNLYARTVLRLSIKDLTGGFNGWRKKVLQEILTERIDCEGYFFQIWLKWQAIRKEYKTIEVPITFRDRTVGVSKFKSSILFEGFLRVIKMQFQVNSKKARIKN